MRAVAEPLQERGEATRQRLIEAALAVFGESGFDGASTRMLADRAGANLAAIPYHFRSKEGLYRAAAQHIVDRMAVRMTPMLDEIELALGNPPLLRKEAIALLHRYLDALVMLLIGWPEAGNWCAFIMREQLTPGAAFDVLYEGFMRRIGDTLADLLSALLRPKNDRTIAVRAIAIFGQILVFRTARQTALRRLGCTEFSDDQLKQIQSIVRDNVDRIVAHGV